MSEPPTPGDQGQSLIRTDLPARPTSSPHTKMDGHSLLPVSVPQPATDDRSVEEALRELLGPLDRHLERGRTFLAATLVLSPMPFILMWLLDLMSAKHAAGWTVVVFGSLVVLGLGWEMLISRVVRRRFDRRFPFGSALRSSAIVVLAQLETPNRIEEKLREALLAQADQRIVRHRPEFDPSSGEHAVPMLELPPHTPPPLLSAPKDLASPQRPGGYYDYIPLEPLPSEESNGKSKGV